MIFNSGVLVWKHRQVRRDAKCQPLLQMKGPISSPSCTVITLPSPHAGRGGRGLPPARLRHHHSPRNAQGKGLSDRTRHGLDRRVRQGPDAGRVRVI